MINTKFGS